MQIAISDYVLNLAYVLVGEDCLHFVASIARYTKFTEPRRSTTRQRTICHLVSWLQKVTGAGMPRRRFSAGAVTHLWANEVADVHAVFFL